MKKGMFRTYSTAKNSYTVTKNPTIHPLFTHNHKNMNISDF